MSPNKAEKSGMIGIIGGVGPMAGLDFVHKIIANTKADCDQDHINCMLISCPSIIPDRTNFLLQNSEDNNPAFGIFESARRLYMAGVRITAVACNTAHAKRIFGRFCDMAGKSLPELKIINMLETCADHVKESLRIKHLGLLATKGTHLSGVYHEYFKESDGFLLMEPGNSGQQRIHEAIYNRDFGIKAHSHDIRKEASGLLGEEIQKLIDSGAQAVILGCTELPLAAQNFSFPVPLIDPALLTARRIIALTAPEKLIPA